MPDESSAVRCGRLPAAAESGGVVEREICADDVDATQVYEALRRARWRAAFARLPQVAMSHQRRAAFFVPS
jgi:hypothetical protein